MEAKGAEHERQAALATAQKVRLDHAVAAADCYMQAMQRATKKEDKTRLSRRCKDMLALAEKLKAEASVPQPKGPQSSRQLPNAEKVILLRASKIHGSVFPPWEASPALALFDKKKGEPLYSDDTSFIFSAKQQEIFAGWKRPAELFSREFDDLADSEGLGNKLVVPESESDLVQDITTDCSVVASLSAAMKHLGPTRDSVLATLMYPFDADKGEPVPSQTGKYVFRMYFNGCARQVVVDDRLPSSRTSRTLFVVDRRNPHLIWPALMEKAYLKVRGGYDFPGSNSGTDLYAMTGWIPEQIFLKSYELDLDKTWGRIKNSYDSGDVVVTLGTGRLSTEEEETLGLAGEHDYAVMNLASGPSGRMMLLKNPWCNGITWKGAGSSATVDVHRVTSTTSSPSKPNGAAKTSQDSLTGTFWIPFEDVVQNFESLYLNWNPALFTHRQDHHFSWTIPERTLSQSFVANPQYSIRSPTSGPIWILLSRHYQDEELAIARARVARAMTSPRPSSPLESDTTTSPTSLAEVSNSLGFMSLYMFSSTSGHRVPLADGALQRNPYVDSPNTLMRFDPKAGEDYTLVVAQQDLPLPRYTFTLSLLSLAPLAVARATEATAHTTTVSGAWTRRTAGGNASSRTYFANPQYRLSLPAPSALTFLLTADASEVPVHVALVWARGERVTALARGRDLAAHSGEYRRGAAYCAAGVGPSSQLVPAGAYTVVLSTFEPGQLAAFSLAVGSDVPLHLAPVLAESAGRLRTPAAGGAAVIFRPDSGATAQRARVGVARLTKASVLATAAAAAAAGTAAAATAGGGGSAAEPCGVRVSLELGTGPHRTVLAVCADGSAAGDAAEGRHAFGDAALGLRTGEVDLDPEAARQRGLWLVVEMGWSQTPGRHEIYVEMLSEFPVTIGDWEEVFD